MLDAISSVRLATNPEARHGCSTLKQQVCIIDNKFLNNVKVTAQEAVQLPLSHEVVFINTSQPDERVYLLSSNTDQLADDTEVAESNIITQRLMTQRLNDTV